MLLIESGTELMKIIGMRERPHTVRSLHCQIDLSTFVVQDGLVH